MRSIFVCRGRACAVVLTAARARKGTLAKVSAGLGAIAISLGFASQFQHDIFTFKATGAEVELGIWEMSGAGETQEMDCSDFGVSKVEDMCVSIKAFAVLSLIAAFIATVYIFIKPLKRFVIHFAVGSAVFFLIEWALMMAYKSEVGEIGNNTDEKFGSVFIMTVVAFCLMSGQAAAAYFDRTESTGGRLDERFL